MLMHRMSVAHADATEFDVGDNAAIVAIHALGVESRSDHDTLDTST